MRRNIWIVFGIIIIITVLSGLVDWPTGPNLSIGSFNKELKIHEGLDLQGGTELTYQADLSSSKDKNKDLNNLKNVFENRVNKQGVSESSIQTSGNDRIIIQLPGIKDINSAVARIGQTYELNFMTLASEKDGIQLHDYYTPSYVFPQYWKKTELTGKNLISASVSFDNSNGANSSPIVELAFDGPGKEIFSNLTKENINQPIAIVLDNGIVSSPTVQTQISDGKAIINGMKDTTEAKNLAKRLNEGMLPVPAKLVSQRNVSATLGTDSVQKSLMAGIIGLILVALFMIIYYKVPGLLATFALLIYSLIVMALFKLIPVTLTLAGIAGFILSIGMAVDANILIFERTKEELADGKTTGLAIEEGFRRAWTSIRDSNFSSLITCLILYGFTTGLVRGFALTLAIGILISMFSAITVTRTFLRLALNLGLEKRLIIK